MTGRPCDLLGRDVELGLICRRIDAGQPVAIVGPAGIGKTALARSAVAAAGGSVREGAAVDFLQARPFLPLRRVLGRAPTDGDAAAVAAEVRAETGHDVLLLDDLQWSDVDTVEVLPALAATGPLLVTVRPGGDIARRVVKQMETLGDVLDLAPLDHRAAHALAQLMLPHASKGTADRLVASSGGNPLAIKVLACAGAERDAAGFATLQAVIEDCPRPARDVLARLRFRDPGIDAETAGVSDLVERRLVEILPDGEVRARAEVFCELGLAMLPDGDRRVLHRQRAEESTDPGDAALHWAAAGELARAHDAAAMAAAAAPTPASQAHFLTIVAQTAPAESRWSATRTAVLALLDLGRIEDTKPLLGRLEGVEPPTPADAVDSDLMRARLALDAQRPAAVLDITIETLSGHREIAPEQLHGLLVLRAGAKGELFDIDGGMADARAAIDVAEEAGLSATRARMVLAVLGVVGGRDEWRTELPAVLADSIERNELAPVLETGRLFALARFFDCDIEGGVAVCDQLAGLAITHNNLGWERDIRGVKAVNLSLTELAAPPVVDELRALIDDPAIDRTRHAVAVLLAIAESDLGDVERADDLLREATKRVMNTRPENLDDLMWARCEVAWTAGRLDECADVARVFVERASPLSFGAPSGPVLLRWVAWARGESCTDMPVPTVVFPAQRGLIDEARAIDLLATPGRSRDAADMFLRAAELHDRYLRRAALRCRWAAGEALRLAGETAAAADLLHTVRRACEEHGFAPLRARVDASLRPLGAVRPAKRSGQGPLTSRQREILSLVRLGLSTTEIAARLHLRPSTIDSHVRNSVKRLGASNRREAALLVDVD